MDVEYHRLGVLNALDHHCNYQAKSQDVFMGATYSSSQMRVVVLVVTGNRDQASNTGCTKYNGPVPHRREHMYVYILRPHTMQLLHCASHCIVGLDGAVLLHGLLLSAVAIRNTNGMVLPGVVVVLVFFFGTTSGCYRWLE